MVRVARAPWAHSMRCCVRSESDIRQARPGHRGLRGAGASAAAWRPTRASTAGGTRGARPLRGAAGRLSARLRATFGFILITPRFIGNLGMFFGKRKQQNDTSCWLFLGMYDYAEQMPREGGYPWLLLIHQLPPSPLRHGSKVWRAACKALGGRHGEGAGGMALAANKETQERLRLAAKEIVESGGPPPEGR